MEMTYYKNKNKIYHLFLNEHNFITTCFNLVKKKNSKLKYLVKYSIIFSQKTSFTMFLICLTKLNNIEDK